jgi:hypothetical protein
MLNKSLITKAHSLILDPLVELYTKGKLPHALLFYGPSGIGKYESALYLAQKLLAHPFKTALDHPDCLIINPDSSQNIYSIDQIRQMQEMVITRPYEAKARIFILDTAERMTFQAANAFLKLLEEPPEDNYFILISDKGFKLLPTISSRVQKIAFFPIPKELFESYLDEHKIDLGPFLFLAEGAFGKAETVFKYKAYLESLAKLLPYSYRQEWVSYRALFEQMEGDETFEFLEFLPLLEQLLTDYAFYSLSLKTPHYPWEGPKSSLNLTLNELKDSLLTLNKGYSSHIKLSHCLDNFFKYVNN